MSKISDIWKSSLEYISAEISSPVTYRTWIETISPYKMTDGEFYISVPTEINKIMIEQRYKDLIENSILEVIGKKLSLEITIGLRKEEDEKEQKKEILKKNTTSNYTFENFVVGKSNQFAHAASVAVAETPGKGYNPLFIWGGAGLGKTHLMHAIENYVIKNHPNLKTTFVSAETFTIELIESVTKKTSDAFREKYRNTDVLFVDDIHFIAGKPSTEEEFHNTFNTLFDAGKQIVLTSDRPPNEIPNLAERLKSRFGWGILCDIQPPEYETRIAILKQKAQDQNVSINTDILMYIADNITMNIRELEGVFKTLSAYSGLVNKEITKEIAEDAIRKYRSTVETKFVTPEMILESVSKLFRVNKDDITSKRKTKEIVIPRQISIYLFKNFTELSYNKIGEYFGGKDHSTVMHAVKKVEEYLKTDEFIKDKVETLTKDLKNFY